MIKQSMLLLVYTVEVKFMVRGSQKQLSPEMRVLQVYVSNAASSCMQN